MPLMTRRAFLRTGSLGAAATASAPQFLTQTFAQLHEQADGALTQVQTGKDGTILVVIQLSGGNDGLNTLIPVGNDYYAKARPQVAITQGGLPVQGKGLDIALHPSLEGMHKSLQDGKTSIIQGVGYPNPNRSHFRSTEIWHRASSDERVASGWVGRYFDHACQGADPLVGVATSGSMPEAFIGKQSSGVLLNDSGNFRWRSEDRLSVEGKEVFESFHQGSAQKQQANTANAEQVDSNLSFIERTALDTQVAIDQVKSLPQGRRNGYPGSGIGRQLELIARMIAGGFNTRVYYASHGGFDTHARQGNIKGNHAWRLSEYDQAINAFLTDLKAQGNAQRVVVLCFSEFGRRVAENASGGTDHGAAAPLFLHGEALKGGIIGKMPSLAPDDLVNGDLAYHTDFRQVYATLLKQWLGTDPNPILGKEFAQLDLFS